VHAPFGAVQVPQLSLQQTISVAQCVVPQAGPPGRQVPVQTATQPPGVQPGGWLQTPSSVVQISPEAHPAVLKQIAVAPPAPAAPPAPPPPAAPPLPVGSSGQVMLQYPRPSAPIVQTVNVRPTRQPSAGIGMSEHGPPSKPPLPPSPVVPAVPLVPAPPSEPGISGWTEQRAAPPSRNARPRRIPAVRPYRLVECMPTRRALMVPEAVALTRGKIGCSPRRASGALSKI